MPKPQRGEAAGHSLQPTMLLNDALLRLAQQRNIDPASRSQVLAAGARIIRRSLVDYARKRKALKRGGQQKVVSLEVDVAAEQQRFDLLALHEALKAYERKHSRGASIVEMKYFGGLTNAEIARELGLSPRTVDEDLRFSKAWLRKELSK